MGPLAVLLVLLAVPALAQAQHAPQLVPLDPAVAAYESQLHSRLGWLGQQDYALRHDDDALRHRRRKVMAIALGAVGGVGTFCGLWAMGVTQLDPDDDGISRRAVNTARGVTAGFGTLALSGVVLGVVAAFTRPHREEYRQIRLEQRDIRRELKRLHQERGLRLSHGGLSLRF